MQGNQLRWTPWDNCSYPAILNYPDPGFPEGVPTIILAALILFASCLFLARICDFYFLPAVKLVADRWNLKGDVVNAVIFASAASWPELAISIITVFDSTQAGVGIGTIVGTSVFNTLAVPALCSFFYTKGSPVDPVTTTRDTAMSAISLLLLGLVLKDNSIGWWNASIMLTLYVLYVIGLASFSAKQPTDRDNFEKCNLLQGATKFYVQPSSDDTENFASRKYSISDNGGTQIRLEDFRIFNGNKKQDITRLESGTPHEESTWCSKLYHYWNMITDVSCWPFHNFLRLVMPPHESFPYLVIFLGMVYIGIITYVVCWMITTLGYKLSIPNSLLGLTVLSVGLGYPDLISSLKVAKEGTASAALSNALGANTFNILICLGLPWFIKAVSLPDEDGGELFLDLDGVTYSINIMFAALLMFYSVLIATRFIFNAKVGCICIAIYMFFVITMSLLEFNVFFPVNKPLCNIKDFYNDPSN
ncbi:hypothetical protein GE061_009922 [Apolygus lucorum]|uniref:Sodium/calcium exchanger membrane region domain-containing protein n=1 Tax=Apolygus lucorum TaxID=248454 RepID=A0A8S9Y3N4_APOLU|nr:hypothetical protein GE061_009922 [Apolygus lucorum]